MPRASNSSNGQGSFVLLNVHRVGDMSFVLKTLLLAPSAKKLTEYQSQFLAVFKAREPLFDACPSSEVLGQAAA
jgi:hypothetical protein